MALELVYTVSLLIERPAHNEQNKIQQWKCVEHICQDQNRAGRMPNDLYLHINEQNKDSDSARESKDDSIYHIVKVNFVRLSKCKEQYNTPEKNSKTSSNIFVSIA